MKKDIEWLKNEILGLSIKARHKENNQREWHMGHEMALFDVNKLIDQLDEPETLSEEWIEKHTVNADTISYYSEDSVPVVTVSNLKGLLVPKQDKSVVPQFVADWIERQKQPDWDYENKEDALADSIHFTLYSLEANYPETNPDVVLRKPVNEWLNDDRKNYWKLIDGVRYGYEVEKEKTYIVDIEGILFLAKFDDEPDVDAYGETILYDDDYIIELTEQEIKDYDERYWAFAEEVTE